MTASTRYSGHPAYHGRLHYPNSAWCAKDSAEDEDWLQIDLGTTYEICGAATQGTGNHKYNEYVTKFKLSYSSEGSSWTMYTGTGGSETVGSQSYKLQKYGKISKLCKKTLPYQLSYDLFSFCSKKTQIAKCCLLPDFFKVHFFYKRKIQVRVSAEVSPYSASFSSKVNQYE